MALNWFTGRIIRCSIVVLLVSAPVMVFSFGKNKVNREVFDWKVFKTVHFNIYYPAGLEDLARYTARIVEEGYVHIADRLKHELTQVIPVVVYPSHIDFQETNILLQIIGEGIGGFTEAFKNRVVVPFTGSYAEYRHVLVHELTHAFHYNMLFDDTSGAVRSKFSYSGVPLWLIEGMSEYLSLGFDETADMVMRDVFFNDQYATLMDLTKMRVKSGYLIYKEGQAFYFFLEKHYGRDAMGELFRDLRDLRDVDEAFKAVTGKTLEEINGEFIRFFKKRYYPIVRGKRFAEEEGTKLTDHQKTRSSFNVCPAVSPDGKKIAFITNQDIYSTLSIIDVEGKKKKKVKTLVRGSTSAKFEGMHLQSNYLSWSADGNHIVFVSQSGGRDVIFLVDSRNGRVAKELRFPLRGIMDPALSRDGTMIAFVGILNGASDLFVYNLKTSRLRRITADRFSERYPKLSSDNGFILYSSNWNREGNFEQVNYGIFRIPLAGGEPELIIPATGSALQADLSSDDKKILYISNHTGIYNAYVRDIESGKDRRLTDVLCGIYYPRWFPGERKIALVAYQNLGYDIFVKTLDEKGKYEDNFPRDTDYIGVKYPQPYFNLSRSVYDDYTVNMSPDWIFFGIGGTVGYGFAGFARVAVSDYMGEHRIILTGDYLRYSGDSSDINFDAVYYYLKKRWDYGIGIFRQRNPYGIFTLGSINDIIHNVYLNTLYMEHYGVYAVASYPFSKFFRFNIKGSSSRYERDYSENSGRPDTFANLNQVSLSLNFDNVLWGYMVPVDGTRGQIEVGQSFNLTGQDYEFTTLNVDMRKYFLISKKYVFAFRGAAGRIFGADSGNFRYYLGGFNTLRGHPFQEYGGNNYFMGNIEFRFIFIEGIKMGWPLFFRIGGIGGVLFTDFGSAWDEEYRFFNSGNGEFQDFKMDMGFGFRLTLYPLIILKLDYAWPYYYKSFGDRQITFSLGFEY